MNLPINQVIHGDCLEVIKQWPDKCIDLVLTDIPYNISKKHGGLREIDYGEWDKYITPEIVSKWVQEMVRLCKGTIYIFCADQQFSDIFRQLEVNGMIVRKYEWLKTNPNVMNGQHFWLSSGELCVCAKWPNTYFNGNCEKGYRILGSPQDRVHPTQKPLQIMEEFITRSSNENDIILDPFGGSCTTAIAAENLNRKWICIEKEEKYVNICRERIDSLTKQLF